MTDDELVSWLTSGAVVIVTGPVPALSEVHDLVRTNRQGLSAEESWGLLAATYDPCGASRHDVCLYCPWERCFRNQGRFSD